MPIYQTEQAQKGGFAGGMGRCYIGGQVCS